MISTHIVHRPALRTCESYRQAFSSSKCCTRILGHSRSKRPANVLAMQEHTQRYHPLSDLNYGWSRLMPVDLCNTPCRTVRTCVRARGRRRRLNLAWPSYRRLSTHELGFSVDCEQRLVRLEVYDRRVQGVLAREYDVHLESLGRRRGCIGTRERPPVYLWRPRPSQQMIM